MRMFTYSGNYFLFYTYWATALHEIARKGYEWLGAASIATAVHEEVASADSEWCMAYFQNR